MEREPYLAGEIDTTLYLSKLFEQLSETSLVVEYRDSAHYIGNRYIRIGWGDVFFTVEDTMDRVMLVNGEANTLEGLIDAALHFSQALTNADMCHRLEVYDGVKPDIQQYFHHRWEQEV